MNVVDTAIIPENWNIHIENWPDNVYIFMVVCHLAIVNDTYFFIINRYYWRYNHHYLFLGVFLSIETLPVDVWRKDSPHNYTSLSLFCLFSLWKLEDVAQSYRFKNIVNHLILNNFICMSIIFYCHQTDKIQESNKWHGLYFLLYSLPRDI